MLKKNQQNNNNKTKVQISGSRFCLSHVIKFSHDTYSAYIKGQNQTHQEYQWEDPPLKKLSCSYC